MKTYPLRPSVLFSRAWVKVMSLIKEIDEILTCSNIDYYGHNDDDDNSNILLHLMMMATMITMMVMVLTLKNTSVSPPLSPAPVS